jgi:hypothetical protein
MQRWEKVKVSQFAHRLVYIESFISTLEPTKEIKERYRIKNNIKNQLPFPILITDICKN